MDAQILASKSLFEAFLITASRAPHAIAWIAANPNETRPTWTWSELRDSVCQTASYLIEHGVRKGDRVANLGRNCAQWAILDLACSAIGAIHAPIDTRYPASWIDRCVSDIAPALVFSDRNTDLGLALPLAAVGESTSTLPRSPTGKLAGTHELDDPACILFTSGTTNHPRGVVLSHRNLLSNAIAKLNAMPQTPDDLRLNLLPFSHSYARTCELTAWILASGIMACAHGIDGAIQHAARLRPQLINAVPLFYEEIARRTLRPSLHGNNSPNATSKATMSGNGIAVLLGGSVRRLASGGAPIHDALRRQFQEAGLPIFQGYGLTEASPVVCSNREHTSGRPLLDGVGPPVQGVRIRVDADRRIWVAGEGVMLGYWRNPEATSARIIDGWLDTGDIAAETKAQWLKDSNSHDSTNSLTKSIINSNTARIQPTDSEDALCIEGRWDDVQVLANGYKFSPRPMEQRLLSEIKAIKHCVLLGTGRHEVLLAVQLAPGFENIREADILGRARDVLWDAADFARPQVIWLEKDAWSISNHCLHWKGGPNRRRIQDRVQAAGSS